MRYADCSPITTKTIYVFKFTKWKKKRNKTKWKYNAITTAAASMHEHRTTMNVGEYVVFYRFSGANSRTEKCYREWWYAHSNVNWNWIRAETVCVLQQNCTWLITNSLEFILGRILNSFRVRIKFALVDFTQNRLGKSIAKHFEIFFINFFSGIGVVQLHICFFPFKAPIWWSLHFWPKCTYSNWIWSIFASQFKSADVVSAFD